MLSVNMFFFFCLNMATIMVMTMTIYVNATMIMVVSKTIIMTVVATMTKSMTINMTKIFKQVQKHNFYCLLRIIKVCENSICTSPLKNRCFFFHYSAC